MSSVTVQVNNLAKDKWDAVVTMSPQGTLFHTWDWLKSVEKFTNLQLLPLMVYRGTQLLALYPFFIRRQMGRPLAFSPPPKAYLLYLGPVIVDYEKMKQDKKESVFLQVQDAVDTFVLKETGCRYIRIRTSPGLYDSRPLRWSGYKIEPLYTYRLDLSKGLEHVWEQFDRKLRVEINKAKKEGVTVREGNWEDLIYIYNALFQRYIEQGAKPTDYMSYLKDLYDKFSQENLKVFVAEYRGNRIGGTINLCYKNIMYLWVGVPKCGISGISANDLVQWEAMNWAHRNGYRIYEEMDAGDDPRLRYFKSKYNPDIEIWYSATKYSSIIYEIAEKISIRMNKVH